MYYFDRLLKMTPAATRLSLKRLADSSLRVPSPILLLCLVFFIQSLSASFSPRGGTFLVRGDDYEYGDLVNPVTDTWDYEDPDQDPVVPDKDLDKLRPDESGKPDATGDQNKDGNENDKDSDNGMQNKRPTDNAETIDRNDDNDEKKFKASDDPESDSEVATTGETVVSVPEPEDVKIVDGVVTVPAAVNGTIVANVPEILPPVPVAQDTSNSAVLPTAPAPEMMELVMDQLPGETTGGVAPRVVGLVVAAVVGMFF